MKKNFKKLLTGVVSGVLATAAAFSITIGNGFEALNTPSVVSAASTTSYDPKLVVAAANKAAATGIYNGSGYKGHCLAFVADIVTKTYGISDRNSECCAKKYADKYIDEKTTDTSRIPLGADVFFSSKTNTVCSTCHQHCGHIGIYVGNGQIVHAWSGKIQKMNISKVVSCGYTLTGWGWHGNYNFSSKPVNSEFKTIMNVKAGKMLNVVGNSSASKANVTVYQKDGTTGQGFKKIAHGTKNGYTKYVIEAQCSPNCALNVWGSTSTNDANVNMYTKSGNDTQDWIFDKAPNYGTGYYIIRSANNTNLVLASSGTANSSNVQLAVYKSGDTSQIWYMA